jgi:hypothetical protein
MRPARRCYLVQRPGYRKQLMVQARMKGRASPYWLMTDPLIVSVSCPACNAPKWHHCTRPNGDPKARPHDQRCDAYSAGVKHGSVEPWQFALGSAHSLPLSL